MKKVNSKYVYLVLLIVVLIFSVIGSTYAYISSSAMSASNDINTASSNYSISMAITPIYNDFSLIPMNDSEALKGLKNECRDKYGRGACNLYNINVFGYDASANAISGYMNVNLDNIENLSYMVLEEIMNQEDYNDDSCVEIDSKKYCVSVGTTRVIEDTDLSLGDSYDVSGMDNKNLLLLIWLTNLEESQNAFDIGHFNATVNISLGNGGKIAGTIDSAINENSEKLQSEE